MPARSMFIALICSWAGLAEAQVKAPVAAVSPRSSARSGGGAKCTPAAEAHRKQADELLAESVYDKAIAEYAAAAQVCANPKFKAAMIFNTGLAYKKRAEQPIAADSPKIALALRQHGIADRREALGRFREFLERIPKGKLSDEARSYVMRLEIDIEQQEAHAAAEAAGIVAAEERERRAAERRHREAVHHRRVRLIAFTSGGIGAAALGIGGFYGWRAHALSDELSKLDDWTPTATAKVSEGERAETRAIAWTVAGGVALAAAGVLYWRARPNEGHEKSAPVAVIFTGNQLAVASNF